MRAVTDGALKKTEVTKQDSRPDIKVLVTETPVVERENMTKFGASGATENAQNKPKIYPENEPVKSQESKPQAHRERNRLYKKPDRQRVRQQASGRQEDRPQTAGREKTSAKRCSCAKLPDRIRSGR